MTYQPLKEFIEETHMFETDDDRKLKFQSVKHLESIATNWIIKIANNSVTFTENGSPCHILLQGSTILGVCFKGSDLDAVLVVPNFIQINDFFGSFYKDLSSCDNVTDLVAIQDTFVPLIKMKLNNIEIDLVLSRLSTDYVPKKIDFKNICSDLYTKMDPISIRGLSGVHMSREFASLVPNKLLFKNTLKAIRAWVRARRLNDYVYGFPSSTAWAIMTAYICNRTNVVNKETVYSDDLGVVKLLKTFFSTFSKWCWPDPVIISSITKFDNIHSLYSWDPQRNARDSCEVMPIITPVFPHKNSAFTARLYTRKIFSNECRLAEEVLDDILAGKRNWNELFKPYDIVTDYNHFICLTLHASDKNELNRLGGMVDSRLRDFAQFLEEDELIDGARIMDSQPMKVTGPNGDVPSGNCRSWLVALDIHRQINDKCNGTKQKVNIDVSEKISAFYKILQDRAIGIAFDRLLEISYKKRKDLLTERSSQN